MASSQSTGVPTLTYRSTGPMHLAALIHHIYNVQPQLAPHIKTIILSTALDDIDNSYVLELLYCKDWSENIEVQGNRKPESDSEDSEMDISETDTDERTLDQQKQHPFTTIREDLSLLIFEDNINAARAIPTVYLDILATLLSVCANLETLYVPNTWIAVFKTGEFKKLRFFGVTEHLDAVRSRRDSGVEFDG